MPVDSERHQRHPWAIRMDSPEQAGNSETTCSRDPRHHSENPDTRKQAIDRLISAECRSGVAPWFYDRIHQQSPHSSANTSHVLSVVPIHSCRAQQCTGSFMMKSTIHLDISREGWAEGLSSRCNPIDDCALQTLRVIGSGT
jgi:hypothetical protein